MTHIHFAQNLFFPWLICTVATCLYQVYMLRLEYTRARCHDSPSSRPLVCSTCEQVFRRGCRFKLHRRGPPSLFRGMTATLSMLHMSLLFFCHTHTHIHTHTPNSYSELDDSGERIPDIVHIKTIFPVPDMDLVDLCLPAIWQSCRSRHQNRHEHAEEPRVCVRDIRKHPDVSLPVKNLFKKICASCLHSRSCRLRPPSVLLQSCFYVANYTNQERDHPQGLLIYSSLEKHFVFLKHFFYFSVDIIVKRTDHFIKDKPIEVIHP